MSISGATSCRIIDNTDDFYDENSPDDGREGGSWLHRNVTCRAGYFLAFVSAPIAASADLLLGSIASVASILTGGLIQPVNEAAQSMTRAGGAGLANTYFGLIRLINPAAPIQVETGMISNFVSKKLLNLGGKLRESDNLFTRHVLSRIVYLGSALSSVPLRIIDFVIGIFAALGSLVTVGKFKTLNDRACAGLHIALIVYDLYIGLVKTINPWTK